MSRLNLDAQGTSFFDLTLTHRRDGFGAILFLHIEPGPGRSGVVLRKEHHFGWRPKAMRRFLDTLDRNDARPDLEACDHTVCFSLRPADGDTWDFEAFWKDGGGLIEYKASIPSEDAARFKERIRKAWRSIEKWSVAKR